MPETNEDYLYIAIVTQVILLISISTIETGEHHTVITYRIEKYLSMLFLLRILQANLIMLRKLMTERAELLMTVGRTEERWTRKITRMK